MMTNVIRFMQIMYKYDKKFKNTKGVITIFVYVSNFLRGFQRYVIEKIDKVLMPRILYFIFFENFMF